MKTLQNINILTAYLTANADLISKKTSEIAAAVIESYNNSGKILSAGNGGSASDAQHIACELIGRFLKERKSLAAVCLNCNVSILTAVANDYGYDKSISRQVVGLCEKNDLIFLYSTSGNSKNLLEAAYSAKKIGAKIISFTGFTGGALKNISDINFNVGLNSTPRVQEVHTLTNHLICELVEDLMFQN